MSELDLDDENIIYVEDRRKNQTEYTGPDRRKQEVPIIPCRRQEQREFDGVDRRNKPADNEELVITNDNIVISKSFIHSMMKNKPIFITTIITILTLVFNLFMVIVDFNTKHTLLVEQKIRDKKEELQASTLINTKIAIDNTVQEMMFNLRSRVARFDDEKMGPTLLKQVGVTPEQWEKWQNTRDWEILYYQSRVENIFMVKVYQQIELKIRTNDFQNKTGADLREYITRDGSQIFKTVAGDIRKDWNYLKKPNLVANFSLGPTYTEEQAIEVIDAIYTEAIKNNKEYLKYANELRNDELGLMKSIKKLFVK